MKLLGIDGCRAGWVVVWSDRFPESVEFSVVARLEPVFDAAERAGAFIAIDVPIGLPDREPRACDLAARAFLRVPRKSSVFPAPCRAALGARTFREACDLNERACGKKVTLELYNILGKIREVDHLVGPDRQRWIREAHPEVIFATLAGPGAAPLAKKTLPEGQSQRGDLLSRFISGLDLDRPRQERSRLARSGEIGNSGVALDDIIDACACLVAAYRLSAGLARVFPEGTVQLDSRGLRMEIVA